MTELLHSYDRHLELQVKELYASAFHDSEQRYLFKAHFGTTPSECITERLGSCSRSKIFYLLNRICNCPEQETVGEVIISLELLHQCALILDDIQDDAVTRKGKPTLWRQCSKEEASLFVFHPLFLALNKIARAVNHPDAFKLVTETALNLLDGQNQDLSARWGRSFSEYCRAAEQKTGRLYSFAGCLALLQAGISDLVLRTDLDKLLLRAGIAHQICDDITDASTRELNAAVFDNHSAMVRNVRQSVYAIDRDVDGGDCDTLTITTSEERKARDKLQFVLSDLSTLQENVRTRLSLLLGSPKAQIWDREFIPLLAQLTNAGNNL